MILLKLKNYLIFKLLNYRDNSNRRLIGKNIFNVGYLNIKLRYNIQGKSNEIYFNNAKTYNCKIFIRGNNNRLIIQENCIIKNTQFWIEGDNNIISIGRGTTIESAHFAATEKFTNIDIGDDCMFSNNITIRTGDSHPIYDLNTNLRINTTKDVNIRDHVWVGSNVTILKGCIINEGSVIGSNSIITSVVPSNVVVAGCPATIIKSNIKWKRTIDYVTE